MAPPARLRVVHVADETARWEVFRGHLLDPAHARTSRRFEGWHAFVDFDQQPAPAPLISIRRDQQFGELFVTRQILSYGFEAYEDAPGVILTRPLEKWVGELVGVVTPASLEPAGAAAALGRLVYAAVVGSSRLPITSLESPLPDFSLGRLAYLSELSDRGAPWTDSLEFLAAALSAPRSLAHHAKALETALRDARHSRSAVRAQLEQSARAADRGQAWLEQLLRTMFNGVALSPYTGFADALVGLVVELASSATFGPAAALDTLGYMLRHLCRHLTAFDLSLFHNVGANYPDALFLDTLLAALVQLAGEHPQLMLDENAAAHRRRRALRQACLVRRHYEGHRVPDAPTSMGENLRVLPEPFARVPEEQIHEPAKRRRRLYDARPTDALLDDTGRRALAAGLADLDDLAELVELGRAVFLDRPLGAGLEPGAVDRTPLVAYEAFSRSIARARLSELKWAGWIDKPRQQALLTKLDEATPAGVRITDLNPTARPGVVSIADAGGAAPDFVLLRSTRGSLATLAADDGFRALPGVTDELCALLTSQSDVLVVQLAPPEQVGQPVLRVYRDGRLERELPLA